MSDAKLQKLIKWSKLKCEQYDNDTPMKIIYDIMNLSNKSQNVKIIIKAIEKETSIKQHIYNNWPVSKEKIQSKPLQRSAIAYGNRQKNFFPQGWTSGEIPRRWIWQWWVTEMMMISLVPEHLFTKAIPNQI